LHETGFNSVHGTVFDIYDVKPGEGGRRVHKMDCCGKTHKMYIGFGVNRILEKSDVTEFCFVASPIRRISIASFPRKSRRNVQTYVRYDLSWLDSRVSGGDRDMPARPPHCIVRGWLFVAEWGHGRFEGAGKLNPRRFPLALSALVNHLGDDKSTRLVHPQSFTP
jgi:hypothetical protein